MAGARVCAASAAPAALAPGDAVRLSAASSGGGASLFKARSTGVPAPLRLALAVLGAVSVVSPEDVDEAEEAEEEEEEEEELERVGTSEADVVVARDGARRPPAAFAFAFAFAFAVAFRPGGVFRLDSARVGN